MSYLNIPVSFCIYALRIGRVKEFGLFIHLKTLCSGHFKMTPELKEKLIGDLNLKSGKTLNTYFNYLLKKRWITFNSKSGNYRLIGFKQVANRLKVPSSNGVLYNPKFISCFPGFVAAATITSLMKYRSQKERRSALNMWSARKSLLSASYNLPHTYLSKFLNISKSSAKRYRDIAIRDGFLTAVKTFTDTGIMSSEKRTYLKYADDNRHVRIKNNRLHIQESDKISSKIILKRKRNIRFTTQRFSYKK